MRTAWYLTSTKQVPNHFLWDMASWDWGVLSLVLASALATVATKEQLRWFVELEAVAGQEESGARE